MRDTLTATEVAALTGMNERTVRKEVEHGILPRRFDELVLVYFAVLSDWDVDLSVESRKRLFAGIHDALATKKWSVELGHYVRIDLRVAKRDIDHRLERFYSWKKVRVVTDPAVLGGEPVFRDTRLAVRKIGAMLLRDVNPSEIREDYPYLADEDLEMAKVYAIAYPRVGRPGGEASS